MSVFPQYLLDIHDELIVDLFAGGGGASCGIEMATGRQVDVAINHDDAAVSMHRVNHPQTDHHVCDVFEVDPRTVANGRPIGLLWASPDCTHFSKAKGGKPIRKSGERSRALAWVVKRWAGQVRPRVICMENVEEFIDWGPLVGKPGKRRPDPKRKGERFRKFVRDLERMGYQVEWDELRACDYGAPTIRKRLFFIARCDGKPIVWPEPTHGPGTRKPYRTAAEIIDWSIPMCSIFASPDEAKEWAREQRARGWKMGTPRRPLADATMARIARGVQRFVIDAGEPFVLPIQNYGWGENNHPLDEPLRTITANPKGGAFALVAPTLVQSGYGEREGQAPRSLDLHEPLGTVVGGGQKHALVAAYLAKHFTGVDGAPLTQPAPTVTTIDHSAVVCAFLEAYYGNGDGAPADEPLRTVTTKDRLSLITVTIRSEPYVIVDIAMRMLWPHELYAAQGFPPDYVIDRGADGRKFTKTEQVRMVGNSVSPPPAAALVAANMPEMVARDEVAA